LETRPLGLALFKSAVTRSESEYLQDNPAHSKLTRACISRTCSAKAGVTDSSFLNSLRVLFIPISSPVSMRSYRNDVSAENVWNGRNFNTLVNVK
jgi:hypothetical protein